MSRGRVTIFVVASMVLAAACSDGDDTGSAASTTLGSADATAATASATSAADADRDEGDAEEGGGDESASSTEPAPPPSVELARADWTVRPGVEQIAVLDAEPGTELRLVGADDEREGTVDRQGTLVFRGIEPGEYRVESEAETTEPVDVLGVDDTAPPEFYADQELPAGGYGYLETRDGTTLSVNVILPGPVEAGPYPTVVEYSGYQPSAPDQTGFNQILAQLGYAYVGVNVRGSGCSGGAYGLFEPAQSADGYDVIEVVAAQPWVLHQQVGMVGNSYPGISQLYVAATRPPGLAAIAPTSVFDDAFAGVFRPGGILNTGFGITWTEGLTTSNAFGGQTWTTDRIAGGDTECEANQAQRAQNRDLPGELRAQEHYDPAYADPLAPDLLVDRIEVPVFIAGAWQDEQTGSRFATMLDDFTGTDRLYATLTNGVHLESVSAGVIGRYVEFLDLYVARRVPAFDVWRSLNPTLDSSILGVEDVRMPPDRFTGQSYEQALATFEADPPVQVLFEEGAADGSRPGAPMFRFSQGFDAWPPPSATARAWYLAPFDGLIDGPPDAAGGSTTYRADPTALPATFFDPTTGPVWGFDVEWTWQQPPPGTAASFVSAPLGTDTVIAGSGSVDLWIRSSAPDTDLEVTISEIRPDGQEIYVQSGWLRASARALDEDESSELRPVPSLDEDAVEPLPAGEWELVRVELFPVAHAFRDRSQLRLTVDAPGNNRAIWAFETIAAGETVEIGHDAAHPSRIVLPVVPGIDVPDRYPTCTLRGQPCREAPP